MTAPYTEHPYIARMGDIEIEGTGNIDLDFKIIDMLSKKPAPKVTIRDHDLDPTTLICRSCQRSAVSLYYPRLMPPCKV
jgi:hypothetical protein